MITIGLDRALDEEMYKDFSGLVAGGVDFGKKITATHPTITPENHEEYIHTFYEVNAGALDASVRELQTVIDGTSKNFFVAVDATFGEDFSAVEYTGAISIFDCNPRFVDKHMFQVFYQRDLVSKRAVAYHEILHFAFFGYCAKRCATLIPGRDTNSGSYWELSELLNVILLNQPAFQAILQRPEWMFYPSLKDVLLEIEKLWQEHAGDVPKFVEESLHMLDTRRLY